MGENHPSEVLFALWYYRANGLPSISQEDFRICAEAWRELKNEEERKAAEDRRFRELLEGLVEYPGPGRVDSAGGAEDPGDPPAAPRDDKGDFAPQDDSQAEDEILRCAQDDRGKGAQDDTGKAPNDKEKAPTLSGPWSSYKNEIMARLEKARKEDGLTLAQVVAASGGKLTDLQLLDMLNRSRMPMAKWDVLSSALAALGYPEAQDPAPPAKKEE